MITNMKAIILLGVFAFATAYSEYYVLEEIDMDALVKNIDELKVFTDCLLEKIPCNKLYESYRVKTMEAIHESCKKCNPHQKHVAFQYLETLKSKLPEDYLEIRHKYDPENKYFDAHENELKKYAIE